MRFLLQVLIILLLPVFLTLTNVRILMTSSFARWEYAKPDFPNPTIVPLEDRQPIVDTTLAYVKGAGDESLIADMTFDDGRPVYNQREIRHLTDVRVLVRRTSIAHIVSGLVILLGAAYLIWTGRSRAAARALATGSALTVGIIGGIGIIAALAFRFFFVRFHRIFFEGGTWMFPTTDTLIQVFPEKFWFDASLLIVILTLVEAAVIGVLALAWLGIRRRRARRQPVKIM
ncbi:MAG: TIGR01906 family membrane protein [Chloroflexi bacterium]|nr:MAG: TIGR01906 family membrane protein [Chloroflexota bacterium]